MGGLGGAGGASIDARIREIGGRTVVFRLVSLSSDFFCAGCLSISDTVATLRRGTGGAAGGAVATGLAAIGGLVGVTACVRGAALDSASFFFGATFDFDAAGLDTCAVFRAPDFPADLLVVFVAI